MLLNGANRREWDDPVADRSLYRPIEHDFRTDREAGFREHREIERCRYRGL